MIGFQTDVVLEEITLRSVYDCPVISNLKVLLEVSLKVFMVH